MKNNTSNEVTMKDNNFLKMTVVFEDMNDL